MDVCQFLRDTLAFDLLSNVTGVDWPDAAKADAVAVPAEGEGTLPTRGFLEVLYHIYSTTRREGPLRCESRQGSQ
ncbi:MAG: hypothetical protein RLZZ398_1062 [Verrucomicrobiota bacterium]|jgi:NADH:ubiquinone oxidoreductase subunit C